MRKIIQVLTDTNMGGAGMWVLNFLKCFRCNGYDILVVVPEGAELTQKVKDIGMKVCEVKGIADKSFSVSGVFRLKRLLKKERPDLVHSHACLSARIAAKWCGIKVVNTRHCLEEPKQGIKKKIYAYINNSLSDMFIGVSKSACQNLIDCGADEKKVRLVYNGVFPLLKYGFEKWAEVREGYGIRPESNIVGIVARLEDVKNHKLFLDSAELILKEEPDTVFIIAGGGSLENELKEYAKKKGIGKSVIFTGFQEDITNVMNIIDINTLTSKKEALSLSLIEGMSINIPVVATNSGGPNEVVADGVSGYIVENDNPKAFADAVVELIRDPEKREKMGNEGEKITRDLFAPETMVFNLERIYKEV